MSAKTLSKLLNIDENDASVFIEKFKSKFPGLKKFITEQLDLSKKNCYVETIKKRKRYLSNINSTNSNLRARVSRQNYFFFKLQATLYLQNKFNSLLTNSILLRLNDKR